MNTDKILAQAIAKDYARRESSKIIALKNLDRKAKNPANVFAYTFGIVSALIAGTGMSFAMQVIGSGMSGMVLGIVLGVVGFALCGVNYPIYKKILEKRKAKYAYDIIELARRITEEN